MLARGIDLVVARPWAPARLGVAQRLCALALRRDGFHGPALVRPDSVDAQNVNDLVEPPCSMKSAQARGGAMKVSTKLLVRTEDLARDRDEPIRPRRRKLFGPTEVPQKFARRSMYGI